MRKASTMLFVNASLMMFLPVVVALAVRRATGARWTIWVGGAAAWIGSQLVHVPILWGWSAATRAGALPAFGNTADSIVLGLLAAACEEPARALALTYLFRKERGRDAALMLGAGHGGIEAILFGALAMFGAVNVMLTRDFTAADFVAQGVAPDAAATAVEQVREALALPWYESLGGAFERGFAVPFHLALSLLVTAAVRRRSAWPFAVAFAAHAASDGSIGLLREAGASAWTLELALVGFAVPFTIGAFWWAFRTEPRSAAPRSADPRHAR